MQVGRVIKIPGMLLILAGVITACASNLEAEFPQLARTTAGIFLEPDPQLRATIEPGMKLRTVNDRGITLTKNSEGFVPKLYIDAANYCTIAYGHLIKLAPCNGTEPKEFINGVTEPQGVDILRTDMTRAERVVMHLVDVELSDDQFSALCDFVFNVGSANFSQSTLLKVVNAGELARVPGQLRRWRYANGKELEGLAIRREQEIDLFFYGQERPRVLLTEEKLSPIDIRVGELPTE